MSMQTLTILQFIGILAAYLGMTVLLPAFVFYRKVSEERFCVRFMIYLVIGNVYLINLVLVLQLLHISHWITLFLGTVFPAAWALAKVHNTTVRDGIVSAAKAVNSFLGGTMGGRLLLSKALRFIGGLFKRAFLRLVRSIGHNFFDWVGTVGVIVLVLWQYGSNLLWNFGFCFSDMPVHSYWVNNLNHNNIFVAGVYPFGFHCIIYYLHEMFGIYTFVLFRVFGLVEALTIHLVLLAFLKTCCRTKYTPYIALVMYIAVDIWYWETYNRFCGALPQEFGMMFILPSIYFLLAFLRDRKEEKGEKGVRVHSTRYLVYFALSFSATLSIHFYNTMIAGLFCVAVAIGFIGVVFRKGYFGRILLAGILSITLAVLPMGIAFATGTPPEGSLRWGLNIISGPKASSADSGEEEENAEEDDSQGEDSQTEASGQPESGAANSPEETDSQDGSDEGEMAGEDGTELPEEDPRQDLPLGTRIVQWFHGAREKIQYITKGLVFTVNVCILTKISLENTASILLISVFPGALGLLFLLPKKTRHYGGTLVSVALFMFFLYIMLMASWIGIPRLMDQNRCRIYISYLLPAAVALAADALVSLAAGWITKRFFADIVSLGAAGFVVFILVSGNGIKEPINMPAFECNEAIICLTNILRDNKRFMFTVVSANDELRMVENDGYHYETIVFLRGMEGEDAQSEYLTIPTPKIYFFIEKIPIDYGIEEKYEGSGRRVSDEGARQKLPTDSGLGIYKGASRYTVMSRMYYWAQEFRKLYPNEMSVYYETENFVCYEVTQNVYRLFDLSIDYGYNSLEY